MPSRPIGKRLGGSYESSSGDYLLRRYMQLRSQLDMNQRIDFASPTSPTVLPTFRGSPTSSPRRRRSSAQSMNHSDTLTTKLSSSLPTPAFPSATMERWSSNDEQDDEDRLSRVTSQIKATLTELLNQDDVKSDEKFRHWVQDRLLEAEFELKSQRRKSRRRSSLDRDALNTIALSMKSST